jgi:hypothetical protein
MGGGSGEIDGIDKAVFDHADIIMQRWTLVLYPQ